MKRLEAVFFLLIVVFATCGIAGAQSAREKLRISVSPTNYAFLPVFLANDEGYFAEQNLDVEIVKFNGSANTQVPLLARGDLDVTVVVLGPPIFNQLAQGFDLTLIASLSEAHPGWNGATWLMVRQDLWDAGSIRKISDLRGKKIENGVLGTVADVMTRTALANNGVAISDVSTAYTVRGPADWFASMRNKAADMWGVVEPFASELESQKLAHKWLTYNDVTPWIQDAYFAASANYLKGHPDAIRRFLSAILKADREINASNGSWTPKMIAEVAKWSELPPADIARIPGPNYVGQFGLIRTDSIERVQKVLVASGAVQQPIPVAKIIDTSALQAARRAAGIR
jgi:NitT/TauT family transport system substrate-binding protein